MCDPQLLYDISGANSTETATLAPQCDGALSAEVINKMPKPGLKALCKKHDLPVSGTNPDLRKRILDHMTIVARQVPREAPVLQVPPEDSSPAAAQSLPPSSPRISPLNSGMSPPSSESESDEESEKETGPKTRNSKLGRKQKSKYKKEKHMRKLLAGVEVSCFVLLYFSRAFFEFSVIENFNY